MAGTCDQRNPLTRSGTNQTERAPAALDPSEAKIDERELADRLVFGQRYSRLIRFYDAGNQPDETWLPFFDADVSAVLALLAQLPYESFFTLSRDLRTWLADDPARSDADLANHVRLLFHLPTLLLTELGTHYDALETGHSLRNLILEAVARDLLPPLKELIAFAKGAWQPENDIDLFTDVPPDVADYNTTFDDDDPRVQLPGVVTQRLAEPTSFATVDLGDLLAGVDSGGWASLFASVRANALPYKDNSGSIHADIADALEYGAFTKTFDRIFQVIERIALEAESALAASLVQDGHTAHYGLWLAFLQLLEANRSHLNELTGDHRTFYYERVLGLARREAEADKAHLLFELGNSVDDHLLEAGTRFKAGKDGEGKSVAYGLDEDFVVNRATVAELRAVYRPDIDASGTLAPVASTVANSRDGAGEVPIDEATGWAPFGPATAAPARIGFALADRRLFLREGHRTITVTATLAQSGANRTYSSAFKASLTGEEGWHEVTDSADLEVKRTGTKLRFTIDLDGDGPAIVPYDSKLHGDEFSVAEPVLKIEFAFDPADTTGATAFTKLRDLSFRDLALKVEATGCRNFSVANDQGVIDPSKPFQPFGASPAVGGALVLGSSELFSKPLHSLTLTIKWESAINSADFFLRDDPDSFRMSLDYLARGAWSDLADTDRRLVRNGETTRTLSMPNLDRLDSSSDQELENPVYSSTSRGGFIRFVLEKAFGHAEYITQLTLALIDAASEQSLWDNSVYNGSTLPFEPYTPKIMEFTLDYTSAEDEPHTLFHLLPFGHEAADAESGRLFPKTAYEGELYVGIDALAPPQKLSLLFQVVDGTANPLVNAPEIAWHYLRGNEWVELGGQDVDDKTNDFTGSGAVGIAVPDDADAAHDVLPAGRHWIRLAVTGDSDALNDLLSIDAQAATVTFIDGGNDPEFVASPLAPETISKLETSDAAVKKIRQPYESYGGRGKESAEAFPLRVSERLRHKDRASSMWDYERIVLEAFPDVYKVKCINHTELCRDAASDIVADNELKPGHVLVVPVPYVSVGGPVDPLRPYTDKATLEAIEALLQERMSPFVQLEVQNPRIEAVQVAFTVAFTDDIADITFYSSKLSDAIRDHLTPWSYDEGAEISFGAKWYKSAIIDFVEDQTYVDYVKDFAMYHKTDIEQSDDEWTRVDVEVIQATTARSILVSHATHTITEVS